MKKGKLSTIIIIALTLISSVIFTYGSYQTSELNDQVDELEKSISEFNTRYDDLNKNYEEVLKSNDKLTQENSILNQVKFDFTEQSNLLQEANDILIEQNAGLTASLILLQDELGELKNQNIELISENNSLKEEISKLKTTPAIEPVPEKKTVIKENPPPAKVEVEKQPKTINSTVPEPVTPDPPKTESVPAGEIVYWVKNGKVWHNTLNCSSLKNSTEIFSGTIAESGKERLCSRCP